MGCSHNCDSCSAGCGGEKSLKVAANPAATVRKVIGVVSGKGGVGKSLLTSMLSVGMTRRLYLWNSGRRHYGAVHSHDVRCA